MRFSVLGPLEVTDRGQRLPFGSHRQRVLLAALLCHAGRTVPASDLVEAVWRTPYDPRAANNLHVNVHRLRRTLADPSRIRRDPTGYALRVAPDEVDADAFERLLAVGTGHLAAGRTVDASEVLGRALALWRGEPFAGLDDTPLIRDVSLRLTERRLYALECRIEADLALGRAETLIDELAALTRDQPLRERFHAQYLMALHRAGRRAEALDAYRRLRAHTVAELGLEPAAEVRAVHRAILRDLPVVAGPLPGAGPPPDALPRAVPPREAPLSAAPRRGLPSPAVPSPAARSPAVPSPAPVGGEPAALVARASAHARRGEHHTALALGKRALRTAGKRGDPAAMRAAHEIVGTCLREQGRLAAAHAHLAAGLGLAVCDDDPVAEVRALQLIAVIERERRRFADAARVLSRADAVCRDLADPSRTACVLLATGELHLREGGREARQWIEDGLALCVDLDIGFGVAYGTRLLGEHALALDRPARAVDLLSRAVDLTSSSGSAFSLALVFTSLGNAHARRACRRDAVRAWSRAAGLFQAIGNRSAYDRVAAAVPV